MKERLSIFKIGGKVIDDPAELEHFLSSFSKFPDKKMLVHGGGKWVSDISGRLGLSVNMIGGRRITDKETLDVVTMALPGLANKKIVAILQKYGCNAIGLTGADANTIRAVKRPVKDGIDYGFVGDIQLVETRHISALFNSGFVPVFTAMTHDGNGQLFNTNADTVASALSIGLSSNYNVDLYYCFEKKGVLRCLENEDSVIRHIHHNNYKEIKGSGIIHSGMLPKIDNAFDAIHKGVDRVFICHFRDIDNFLAGNLDSGTLITK